MTTHITKRPPSLLTVLALALALPSSACQVGLASIGDDFGDSETDTTAEEGEESGEAGEGQALVPAAGIEIIEIEANQAVAVPLTTPGGAWVGPGDRNAPLVGERDTLVRVHWQVAEGWTPRMVTARLQLESLDGELAPIEQTKLVTGDSERASLDQTFNFELHASLGQAEPGMSFEIELLVAEDEQLGELQELVHHVPIEGRSPVGFEDDPMSFEVVFVPIHYTFGGLDARPILDEQNILPLVDRLYEMLPVQEVVWQIRDELEFSQQLSTPAQLLSELSALRAQDLAAPNVYYHAIVNPGCDSDPCTLGGTSGISMVAGSAIDHAGSRISVSVTYDAEDVVSSAVHELGHNQGLQHIECPTAEASGIDESYPYVDGEIGVWGFGLRSGALYDPAQHTSFMGYCEPAWVSDWGYNKLYDRVRILSSW